ncbi:MAG: hypothetical protein J1G38_05250 [Clostridiales bacterium]|nr:hypothetical protein [Clostridiales bacterium]
MVKKAGCGGSFDGLCCRMVIETKRVFDGCRLSDENVTLTLTTDSPLPQDSTFVSARVIGSELVNYAINENSGRCNVTGDIVTTFAVTYEYGGTLYSVGATHTESIQTRLRFPTAALVPYAIEVQTAMVIGSGAVIGTNAVSVSGCLLRIIKVTAPVDILVPTYGYSVYPPCESCRCPGVSNTQIFPTFDDE